MTPKLTGPACRTHHDGLARRPTHGMNRCAITYASAETTQVYTLLADKVADAEIRAARRRRGRSAS